MSDLKPALNQALSERLCVLAHDMNNGLAIIAGQCELMADHSEWESEYGKRLRVILEVVHRLANRLNGHECRMAPEQNPNPDEVIQLAAVEKKRPDGKACSGLM